MKIKYLIVFMLAAIAVACSDSPEETGRVDVGLINNLSRDGSVSTYVMTDFHTYEKDTIEGAQWEEFDYTELIGGKWPDLSTTLCFQDGHLWEPVMTFSSATGPVVPYMIWKAYCKFSGEKDKKFYVRVKFTYDESERIMKFGNSPREYYVDEFTESCMRIRKIEPTGHWSNPFNESDEANVYVTTGYHQYTYKYKATEPIRFDGEDIMAFDSTAECYRYWVNAYRGKYGRYLDMNKYYAGTAFLENPIIDLDEVDAWIDRYEQSNL